MARAVTAGRRRSDRRPAARRPDRIRTDDPESPPDSSGLAAYRSLRRKVLAVEGAELTRVFESGVITDATRRRIRRLLDLELAGLGDDY